MFGLCCATLAAIFPSTLTLRQPCQIRPVLRGCFTAVRLLSSQPLPQGLLKLDLSPHYDSGVEVPVQYKQTIRNECTCAAMGVGKTLSFASNRCQAKEIFTQAQTFFFILPLWIEAPRC